MSWYQAEGNAVDAVGGYHGVLQNGATFAPGRVGQAFNLDGVDDFVEVADSPQHTPASITLEAWVKPDTVAGTHFILTKYDSSQPNNKSWALLSIDGRVRFGVYQGAVGRVIDTNSPGPDAGRLAARGGDLRHRNAEPSRSTSTASSSRAALFPEDTTRPSRPSPTATARCGSARSSTVNGEMVYFWDGCIDDVGLFNRALERRRGAGPLCRWQPTACRPPVRASTSTCGPDRPRGWRAASPTSTTSSAPPADDILVGNGGNILFGRAGRDILIAGPAGAVPGLVARYTAADGDATDSVGDHDGTVHGGVTFGPGYRGQGFEFNGVDAYVQVPNAPDLEPTTVTVEAWVRATAPGRSAYIVSKGALGGIAASYALYTGTNGGLQFYIGGGGSFALSPDAGTAVWDGEWHHVAGTFDGAVVRLFVDGVEVGTGTPTTLRIGYDLPDSNDLFLGSYNRGYLFNGAIDEVAIHGRAPSRPRRSSSASTTGWPARRRAC